MGEQWPRLLPDKGLPGDVQRMLARRRVPGVAYYRQGHEYLRDGLWVCMRTDESIIPEATTYAAEGGGVFVERIYDTSSPGRLQRLFGIAEAPYRALRFEPIIGLGKASDGEPLVYHTCSQGLTLDRLTLDTPAPIAREVARLLARALRELHDHGVQYADTMPTNFRYAFDDQIILNPHNCMQDVARPRFWSNAAVEDIGIILHTHAYIHDPAEFVASYNEGGAGPRDPDLLRKAHEFAAQVPGWIESSDLPLPEMWIHPGPRQTLVPPSRQGST